MTAIQQKKNLENGKKLLNIFFEDLRNGKFENESGERGQILKLLAENGCEKYFISNDERQTFHANTKNMPKVLKRFFNDENLMNMKLFLDVLLDKPNAVQCFCFRCK